MPTPKPHEQFVAALKELARPSAVAGMARFFRTARSDDEPGRTPGGGMPT
jgi:hypothetical protein